MIIVIRISVIFILILVVILVLSGTSRRSFIKLVFFFLLDCRHSERVGLLVRKHRGDICLVILTSSTILLLAVRLLRCKIGPIFRPQMEADLLIEFLTMIDHLMLFTVDCFLWRHAVRLKLKRVIFSSVPILDDNVFSTLHRCSGVSCLLLRGSGFLPISLVQLLFV